MKTCIFSSADNNYSIYAAISLLSVRRYDPNIDLFILSSNLSLFTKSILKILGIKYIELDLSSRISETWDYPIECYYIFAGPEIFHKMGYDYSIYIDGDILCKAAPADDRLLHSVRSIAGVSGGEVGKVFGADLKIIKSTWGVAAAKFNRINSGVVYFNNEFMANSDALDSILSLYTKCLNLGIPRKGDDSLFALYQLIYQDTIDSPLILPNRYNFIPQYNLGSDPKEDSEIAFFHFGGDDIQKPWAKAAYTYSVPENNRFRVMVDEWRMVAKLFIPKLIFLIYGNKISR